MCDMFDMCEMFKFNFKLNTHGRFHSETSAASFGGSNDRIPRIKHHAE